MPELDFVMLDAFRDELKTAALHGALSGMGALGGVGAAAGALAGGYHAYRRNKQQGISGADALLGSLGGAGRGALLGGAAGALAGGVAGHRVADLGERVTKMPILGTPAQFGQRQVHGVTGWTPREGIESIRGGAYSAKKNLESIRKSAPESVIRAERAAQAAQQAQDAGLTNMPGFIRAMATNPKKAISAGVREQWHGSGVAGKALTVGLPAADALHAAVSAESPDGPGRGERIGRGILPAAVGMASGQLPFAGQLLIGGAAGSIGSHLGRGVDRVRGRGRRPIPPPYKPEVGGAGSEVRVSPEAMMGAGSGGVSA